MVRRGVALLLVFILGFSFVMQNDTTKAIPNQGNIVFLRQNALSYITHEPFNITSDADFETQAWPGNGSSSNPYLIENLNITTNQSSCIWVMNTTSHFIIQNCYFVSPIRDYVSQYSVYPITLANVSNCMILRNQVVNSTCGISGYSLMNCTISENQFNVSWNAIEVNLSNFTIISNNTQEFDPFYYGLIVMNCRNCTVSLNLFKNILNNGIYALLNYNTSFIDNTLIGSISEDSFSWCGITIGHGDSCIVKRNEIVDFVIMGMMVFGSNHLVEDNNITSNQTGVLISTNASIIRGNMLNDNYNAIEVVSSNDTRVYNNEIQGGTGRFDSGIIIHGGYDCDVYSNVIFHIGYGIILQGATRFNISNNIVFDARAGFAFGWSGYSYPQVSDGPSFDCDIINNTFDRGGLYSSIPNYGGWDFNTIRFFGNTVNGRPIGFYAYLDDSEIDGADYGQLFLVSCTSPRIVGGNFYGICSDVGEGVYYDPGQAAAITLVNCSYSWLEDISFHNNTIGVNLQNSYYCNVLGGSGYYNSWAALILWYSHNCYILDVYIRDNLKGFASGRSYSCSISGCLIWENDEAVVLASSPSCSIDHNTIFQNRDAVQVLESDGCEIWSNSIYDNSRGIVLNSSSSCLITENDIYNNTGVGICLDAESSLNEIYNNAFAHNSPNAICDGSSNHWDNQVDTGNWWSDYSGQGPYVIDENDQDDFPIDNRTTTTPTTTTMEPWELDPLVLGIAGGLIGMVLLMIIVIDRRRVVIVD
jgi:parallel beta-helix repeat protein